MLSLDGVDDEAVVEWDFDCNSESIGDVGFDVGVNGGFVEAIDGLALPVFGYAKCNGTDCGLSGILTIFFSVFFLCSVYLFINLLEFG